jgi:hypothetical protein
MPDFKEWLFDISSHCRLQFLLLMASLPSWDMVARVSLVIPKKGGRANAKIKVETVVHFLPRDQAEMAGDLRVMSPTVYQNAKNPGNSLSKRIFRVSVFN